MILGFYGQTNKWTHDHSLAIVDGNRLQTFVQLERVTRRKFDNRMADYLATLLRGSGIQPEELDSHQIAYANTFALEPELFFKEAENNITSTDGKTQFNHPGTSDFQPRSVKGSIEGRDTEATVVPHEIAHLFSLVPFYGIFEENSLLVHVDGAASICNASAWHFRHGKLQLLKQTTEFQDALLNFSYNDLIFDILEIDKTKHLGMPGRLMGYAAHGKSNPKLMKWLKSRKFFREYKLHPREQFVNEANDAHWYDQRVLKQRHEFLFNVAACMQRYFEDKILQFIFRHQETTGSRTLYLSGGAALNIKLNANLVNSRKFKRVCVPPATNDSGLSLGVVSYMAWKKGISLQQCSPFINNYGLDISTNANDAIALDHVDEVCRDLARGAVIGVCIGSGEAGPRALGHRSILAHPGLKSMRDKVSMQIKKREWYRPLAPIILESELNSVFDEPMNSEIAQFMLYEFNVKENMKQKLPGIVHTDGTARAQVVKNEDPELKLITDILRTMKDLHDIPCLINTSFNQSEEPIVHTEEEALNSAKRMGLDAVFLNEKYIQLR